MSFPIYSNSSFINGCKLFWTLQASENANTKVKMERELARVQNMLQGLSQQGEKLSQAMSTIRRTSSGTQLAAAFGWYFSLETAALSCFVFQNICFFVFGVVFFLTLALGEDRVGSVTCECL